MPIIYYCCPNKEHDISDKQIRYRIKLWDEYIESENMGANELFGIPSSDMKECPECGNAYYKRECRKVQIDDEDLYS